MQTTVQTAAVPRRGRLVGLGLALVLQAAFVYALVSGLTVQTIIDHIDPIPVFFPKTDTPPPPPPKVDDRQPDKVFVPDPGYVRIDDTPPWTPAQPDNRPTPQGANDHGPVSVMSTHTIPPYPPIAARLGQEGTVLLRLTISERGTVTEAVVIRSSGSDVLDAAAAAWVKAHWRYQPAVRGGAAVPSTGNVAVTFNLRNAG